jgi:hypothetical protein
MSKFDRFLSAAVLGLLAPLGLFLLFWWGSIPFVREDSAIMILALIGLAAGAVIDLTVLKKFIGRLFLLPVPALVCIGLFYSVMVYGFFMGFPLFNSVVGIVFCYIAVKRSVIQKRPLPEAQRSAGRFGIFYLAVLAIFCVATAFLALGEPSITAEVKGMLGLPFEVTMGMIWALILAGGTLLVLFQFFTTRLIADIVLKRAYEGKT